MRFVTFLYKNLLRRKLRSVLTSIGVAVAVGTTVALLGISDGFTRSTLESLEMRGADIVVVEDGVVDQLGSDLDEKIVAKVEAIPGVAKVMASLLDVGSFESQGSTISVLIQGWEPNSSLFNDLQVKQGRLFHASEPRVAILGEVAARNLGKRVGESVELEDEAFHIVGIFRSFNVFENGCIIAPLKEVQRVQLREGRITGMSVSLARSRKEMQNKAQAQRFVNDVCDKINSLRGDDGNTARLAAQQVRDYAAAAVHLKMASAMAWLTSAIAIIVGTVGVANTMIMSVVERVREISILRAIGWRRSRVVRMIVGESLLLSLLGATVGSVGAVLLSHYLTTLPMVSGYIEGSIAPRIVGIGFLMAIGVGLVGGVYPAYHATRLLPSEGLRHE